MQIRTTTIFLALFGFAFFVVGCDSGVETNDPPRAKFDAEVTGDYTVQFDASTSTDPDGDDLRYAWDFDDGTVTDTTAGNATISHTYEENGPYDVTLTIVDSGSPQRTANTSMEVSLGLTTFEVTVANTSSPTPILESGFFDASDENNSSDKNANPLRPSESYQFSFTAGPSEIPGSGMQLSFATMFIQSNDVYYGTSPRGISLFNDDGTPRGQGSAITVTDSIGLYDAGTEVDQEPGTGPDQAPRQNSPDAGEKENGSIVRLTDTDDDGLIEDEQPDGTVYEYPAVEDGMEVTIQSGSVNSGDSQDGAYEFTVTIENVSDDGPTLVNGSPLLISPGSFAVHWAQTPGGQPVTYPRHTPGAAADAGIEDIAERGSPLSHFRVLSGFTGVTVPLSPGGYAAHSDQIQIFDTLATADEGVERIAEDGNPGPLVSSLQGNAEITDGGAFTTPDGATSAGPIGPDGSYTFTVDAKLGDRLSFGTMYIQSNDLFFAFKPEGIPLFNDDGSPKSLDLTDRVMLYDAGTEQDEEPGVGLNQAPRQDGSNTGPDESEDIRLIGNAPTNPWTYSTDVIEVSISPQ